MLRYLVLPSLLSSIFVTTSVTANTCVNSVVNSQLEKEWLYQVSYNGMRATGQRRLTKQADELVLEQSLSFLLVSLLESSRMSINDANLQTLEYTKEQKGLGARYTEISVDSAKGSVVTERKGKRFEYQSDQRMLDSLGHSLQLQIDLSCEVVDKQVSYALAGTRSVKVYEYNYQGDETINTPWGERIAVRWSREDGDVQDSLWFVPQENYALVRVEHIEKGETSSLMLVKVLSL